MADFCKQCSEELFGKDMGDLARPDQRNHPGYGFPDICEGCGGIQVDSTGKCLSTDCLKFHGDPEYWLHGFDPVVLNLDAESRSCCSCKDGTLYQYSGSYVYKKSLVDGRTWRACDSCDTVVFDTDMVQQLERIDNIILAREKYIELQNVPVLPLGYTEENIQP